MKQRKVSLIKRILTRLGLLEIQVATNTAAIAAFSPDTLWSLSGDNIYYDTGNVAVGSEPSTHKMLITGDNTSDAQVGDIAVEKEGWYSLNFFTVWANAGSPFFILKRAKGTKASPATLADGDQLGGFGFRGYDGNSFGQPAAIQAFVKGAVSTGVCPAYISFSTGNFTATERMIIMPAGNVGINTTTPNAAALLDLVDTTRGFKLMNMSTTQRDNIGSPPEGLLIWNSTTHQLNAYNGSGWVAIT